MNQDEYLKLNKAIEKWLNKVARQIVNDRFDKGVRHRDYSTSVHSALTMVRKRLKVINGAPERASVSFPRQLVFVKYGVGKNRKRGSGKETPKDIIDNIIDKNIDSLVSICAEHYLDIISRNLFIDKTGR